MPKRPGVSASIRLSESLDLSLWDAVAVQHQEIVNRLGNLNEYQDQLASLVKKIQSSSSTSTGISRKDLLQTIIPWKFAVGKPRHALKKHLEANSETAVQSCSRACMDTIQTATVDANDNNNNDSIVRKAVSAMTALQGVGPATSSVILSWIRPDLCAYMYDEVIDTFLPKRTYTLPVYLACNAQCVELSRKLNQRSNKTSSTVWTPALVAQTLWVAARVSASGGLLPDRTLQKTAKTKSNSKDKENVAANKVTGKRSRANAKQTKTGSGNTKEEASVSEGRRKSPRRRLV